MLYFPFFVLAHVWAVYVIKFHHSLPHRCRRFPPSERIISISQYYMIHQRYHYEVDNSDTERRMYAQSGFEKDHSSQQKPFYNSHDISKQISLFEHTHLIHYMNWYPDFCRYGMFYFQNNAKNSFIRIFT